MSRGRSKEGGSQKKYEIKVENGKFKVQKEIPELKELQFVQLIGKKIRKRGTNRKTRDQMLKYVQSESNRNILKIYLRKSLQVEPSSAIKNYLSG